MSLKAGFFQVEITPALGTEKMGFKRVILSDHIIDPLFARIAVFTSNEAKIAFVQLDTICILGSDTQEIRRRIARVCHFPPDGIMISATHNHAGPAVADIGGDSRRDDAYVEQMIEAIAVGFKEALANLEPAEIGFGSCFEFRIAHNRRVVMRDGTVCTHGKFTDPDALYLEGPIDPEVIVMAARNSDGYLLGALVNFACHPTHHGAGSGISAGYPGVLARTLRASGVPVTLFLNGASGNLHTANPCAGGANMSMEDAGQLLAEDVLGVIEGIDYRRDVTIRHASCELEVPYRRVSPAEINGKVRGAQRFIDSAIYEREIPTLVKRIEKKGYERVEIQCLWLGDRVFVSMPGELFVQLGLKIKEGAYPVPAAVVAYANGHIGYLPHRQAFQRGGYETTFCGASCMAPAAGEMLVDAALELVQREQDETLVGL